MQYQQLQPPPFLKGYVRYFWTLASTGTDALPHTLGPLADGCPGLIFQPSEAGIFYGPGRKQLPPLFVYGQTINPTEMCLTGKFKTVGVCLLPNTLKTIFGFNADALSDTCLDADLLPVNPGSCLSEQLLNAPSVTDQIEMLAAYLLAQITQHNAPVDGVTRYALAQMIRSNGQVSLKALQDEVQLSERSFERRFNQHVGISPKLFARVCRFQAALSQLKNNKYTKLSDIAFDNGYADQAHFIRTFKEFTGRSPYQFQKQAYQVVENFSVLIK